MKVNQELQDIMQAAYHYAMKMKHEFVMPEHLLYVSLSFDLTEEIMEQCNIDINELKRNIESFFKKEVPIRVEDAVPVETVGFQTVINQAAMQTEISRKEEMDIGDILVAILDLEQSHASYYLKKTGLNRLELLEVISHGVFSSEPVDEPGDDSSPEVTAGTDKKPKARPTALDSFTTDLTQRALSGKMDPCIGRDDIIQRTLQVLCRRLKNNPILVGDAGVGKTTIAEGLVQKIAEQKVPDLLKGFQVYSLDMGSIIAGTRYRGDFEERMKCVLAELKKKPKVILFIDEIHTIIGAGAVSGSALDASSLLKPVLQTGELRCIGSSTYENYKKYFEKDNALVRRFQKIEVSEPSIEDTCRILFGLRKRYEEYHQVSYTDEALKTAVKLSAQYINDRRLPDKAIDVIDEAGAYTRIQSAGQKEDKKPVVITGHEIEKVVAAIAKIPEKSITSSEKDKLKGIEADLKKRIFGQNSAVQTVTQAVKRSRAGFKDPDKPVASFLFTGPTGVGKTELTRQLANILGIALHRFDMSEYQEQHTVARLIGSPPGYVGYDEGGLLTDAIRRTPHAVLLLDEIEKAHPDVFNVLLQIMDYATLTDNTGKKADFRNVILIMTSNAGSRDFEKPFLGFSQKKDMKSASNKDVERIFTPEFRNRLDSIVSFDRLNDNIILRIVDKELKLFKAQLKDKNIHLKVTPKCKKWLGEKGHSEKFGARNVARAVQENIKDFFVEEVLFGDLSEGGKAVADIIDNKVKIVVTI